MNFLNNIFNFFKNIFNKRIESPELEEIKEKTNKEKQLDFINSLKTNDKNQKIETLICVGDGLGIQDDLKY